MGSELAGLAVEFVVFFGFVVFVELAAIQNADREPKYVHPQFG